MKKALLALGLAGLCYSGFSQNADSERDPEINRQYLIEKIYRERKFDGIEYMGYMVSLFIDKKEKMLNVFYDFDRNGVIDAFAMFKVKRKFLARKFCLEKDNLANAVYIDRDENGESEKKFYDLDDNGILENLIDEEKKGVVI